VQHAGHGARKIHDQRSPCRSQRMDGCRHGSRRRQRLDGAFTVDHSNSSIEFLDIGN
jgi:hypothetical protein